MFLIFILLRVGIEPTTCLHSDFTGRRLNHSAISVFNFDWNRTSIIRLRRSLLYHLSYEFFKINFFYNLYYKNL